MKKQWLVATKKVDFKGFSQELGVDQVIVRLMANRGLKKCEDMNKWLYGDLTELNNPYKLKDIEKAAKIIAAHIKNHNKIMIANDFDCDGICSGYILKSCLKNLGADVYVDTPDRCKDGYGINTRIVNEAFESGVSLIITCDNGIAAFEAANLSAELGIEFIITDHHEVAFSKENDEMVYKIPKAAAIVNPKQPGCEYPFKGICGAVVAFKLMQVLYDNWYGKCNRKVEFVWNFLEFAAMATVADVMELVDENRIIVKYGLHQISRTKNKGLKALIEVNELEIDKISSYHIGFIIGPCLNASGRLATAKIALDLLEETSKEKALEKAVELKGLNEARKDMTMNGVEQAKEIVEESMLDDKVLVICLKCHESIAGIIAGRIKEWYNRPVIVLTETENGLKGSGRSIPAYNMFEKVNEVNNLLTRFGGHPMACGLSMKKENVDEFRRLLNENCGLKDADLVPVVLLDMQMPFWYLSEELIESFDMLAPYGNGNRKPLFAEKGLSVKNAKIIGKNNNVFKCTLKDKMGNCIEAIYFGDVSEFDMALREHFGNAQVDAMYSGKDNNIRLLIAYEADINEFREIKTIQAVIKHYDFPS